MIFCMLEYTDILAYAEYPLIDGNHFPYMNGLAIANTLELLQSWFKPSV